MTLSPAARYPGRTPIFLLCSNTLPGVWGMQNPPAIAGGRRKPQSRSPRAGIPYRTSRFSVSSAVRFRRGNSRQRFVIPDDGPKLFGGGHVVDIGEPVGRAVLDEIDHAFRPARAVCRD